MKLLIKSLFTLAFIMNSGSAFALSTDLCIKMHALNGNTGASLSTGICSIHQSLDAPALPEMMDEPVGNWNCQFSNGLKINQNIKSTFFQNEETNPDREIFFGANRNQEFGKLLAAGFRLADVTEFPIMSVQLKDSHKVFQNQLIFSNWNNRSAFYFVMIDQVSSNACADKADF